VNLEILFSANFIATDQLSEPLQLIVTSIDFILFCYKYII